MPQFDVFRNPGWDSAVRYVVQIQSSRLDRGRTCVVMPLVRIGPRSPPDHALTPRMTVQDMDVHADPLNLATVGSARLGSALGRSSDEQGDAIIRGVDGLISRA